MLSNKEHDVVMHRAHGRLMLASVWVTTYRHEHTDNILPRYKRYGMLYVTSRPLYRNSSRIASKVRYKGRN